jgi:hypothetical protein
LTLIISLTNIAFGQSKDCRNVYYKSGPTIKCAILPIKKINDTVICIIPKNCNDIRFDSTASGHWKVFSHDTLTLLETVDFKNGLRHGQSIYYFDNKKIRAKHNYVKGKLRGEEIIYNEAGQITEKGTYDEKASFKGTVTQYWDNGKIASIQDWKNGWYYGNAMYWDNNGKVIDEKTFEKLWYDCE